MEPILHPSVVIAGPTSGGSPDVVPCPDVDPFIADHLRGVLRYLSADKASCVEGPRHQEFFRVTSTMQDPRRAPPIPPAPSRWRPARRCVFTAAFPRRDRVCCADGRPKAVPRLSQDRPSVCPHVVVPVGNSHSYVLVKPAQDGHGQRLSDGLDGAGDRCILVR
jgi:hypothetical protein